MKNFKIINEKENPLFNRKEITAVFEEKIMPNKDDVKKIISEKFSSNEENIKIKKIGGKFGSGTFKINANIYKSKSDMDNTEPKSKKVKKEGGMPNKSSGGK